MYLSPPKNQKATKDQPTHPNTVLGQVEIHHFTYSWVDEAQENDRANHSPHGFGRTLLKSLRHYLVQAVTHASQLRRKPVKATRWSRAVKIAQVLTLLAHSHR